MSKTDITASILSDNNFNLNDFNPAAIAINIAKQFKTRRLELNLTQGALAKKSGISLGSLKRFESKGEISLKHLLMMAVVLNATEEFYLLFSKKQYQNIEEVMTTKKAKTRQRARTNV